MPAKTTPKKTPGANYMKGRPTLYKGIRMRSRLEADYAAWLDRMNRTWEYEPECFAAQDGQWLPDFRVAQGRTDSGAHLVELKPAQILDLKRGEDLEDVINRVDALIRKMRPAFESEPESSIDLVFWRYGANNPELVIVGARNRPYTAWVRDFPLPLIWVGASQMTLLGLFSETVAEMAWGDKPSETYGVEFDDR